jgi:uncharacterized membrane protein YcaP (DUF421 family)
MATVLLRTVIIYFIFTLSVRLVGKRQIGELQLSEFVTTLMLSELAINCIQDISFPISYSLLPLIFLLSAEVIISFLVTKSKKIKKLFLGAPNIIIKEGILNQKELSKQRMSINELLSELRLKDIDDISMVDYAIIEQNGKLSVFEKKKGGGRVDKSQFCYAIITDGELNENDLEYLSIDKKWVDDYLKSKGYQMEQIFLMTLTKDKKTNIILKEKI